MEAAVEDVVRSLVNSVADAGCFGVAFWQSLEVLNKQLRDDFMMWEARLPALRRNVQETASSREKLLQRAVGTLSVMEEVACSNDKTRRIRIIKRQSWSNVSVHSYRGVCSKDEPEMRCALSEVSLFQWITTLKRIIVHLRNNTYSNN